MYGKRVSENGNNVSEGDMSAIALNEAKEWHDDLMDALYKGRGDKEKTVRGRLADKTGIPESYLYRLQYKFREMTDVAGSAYRALMLLHDELCTRNEAAADEMKAERLELRKRHEANQKPASQGVGMDSSET
jgi:hypothetical protein